MENIVFSDVIYKDNKSVVKDIRQKFYPSFVRHLASLLFPSFPLNLFLTKYHLTQSLSGNDKLVILPPPL